MSVYLLGQETVPLLATKYQRVPSFQTMYLALIISIFIGGNFIHHIAA
jgi:hypothetical protein